MSRPCVLHVIHHLRLGGAETQLLELSPRLIERGFDVHVACLDDRGPLFERLAAAGVPVHFIARRRGADARAVWRLRQLLRALRVDVLNTHSFSAGLWGRVAGVLAGTPHIVATVHTVAGWSQPRKQYAGNKLLQPVTDRLVAVSESVRRSLIERGGLPEARIRVIHPGIAPERFPPSVDVPGDRRRLGLPVERRLVGMVARCSAEKGGLHWVEALARLVSSGDAVHGVLVGDGPERSEWLQRAAALGLAGRLTAAGAQLDVAPWLRVLDVLVAPSLQESFGLVPLEALAAGVPVVATRVGGFAEVLRDGVDAVLVAPADSAALADAVRALLRSPERAARLAAAGRRQACERFSIRRAADEYAALYRDVLATPPAGRRRLWPCAA